MIYLGVDPGLQYAGFGVAQKLGSKVMLVDCGYLKLNPTKSLPERIELFYQYFYQLVVTHQVDCLVLETPFMGKNAQNFLKLGYLRGILYLIAQQKKLQILEFAPTQVKQAITGYGSASKEQVARVIRQLFPKLQDPSLERTDVTDALAVVLCGVWRQPISKI